MSRPKRRTQAVRQRAATALVALLASGCGQRAAPPFELICDSDVPRVVTDARTVVKTTWPIAATLYGSIDAGAAPPATVHLYRDPSAYRAADQRLTGGRFQRNLAFTSWNDRSAHVAIQPQLSDAVLHRCGLNEQTLRLLAHETAHVVRTRALANFRVHPQWFADGNASWIESRVLCALGRIDTPEEDPTYSTDVVRAQRRLQRDALPDLRAILLDHIDALDFYERYAVRWLAFRWLMEEGERPALQAAITSLSDFGGAADLAPRMLAVLEAHLSRPLPAADAEFRRWLAGLQPQWDESIRSLDAHGGAWLQAAFEFVDASAWRIPALAPPWTLHGAAEPLTADTEMRLSLEVDDGGALTVLFGPRDVRVLLEGFERLGPWPRTSTWQPVSFAIEQGDHGVATLTVDGRSHRLPAVCNGRWGLGVRAGGAGRWLAMSATDDAGTD